MASVFDDFEESNQPQTPTASTGSSPFDDFDPPEPQGDKALASLKLAQVGNENPDQFAESARLADKFGVSAQAINYDLPFYKREALKEDTTFNDLANKRYDFFKNQDYAIQAKDDLENLAKIDKEVEDAGFFSNMFNAAASGAASMASGFAKSAALFYDEQSALPPGLVDFTGGNAVGDEANPEVPKALYDNTVTRYLDRRSKELAPKEMNLSILTEAGEGNFENAGKAFAYQVASNAPQLFMMLANPAVGLGALSLSSSGSKLGENLEAGVDPARATSGAILSGGVEAGIESIGGLGSPGFKKALKEVVDQLGEKTAKEVFKQGFKKIVKTGAEEGAEEAVTTLAQAAIDYSLDINDKAFDNILVEAGDAFIVGAGSGMSTTGVALAGDASFRSARNNVQLVQQLGAYQRVGEILKESKLFKRNPEVAEKYLEETFKGTGAEKVYINIDDFDSYFQSENKSGAEVANELEIADAYNKASEHGGDIEISTAKWATVTANTDYYQGLAKDIRFSAEQESVRQIENARSEAQAEVKRAASEAKLEKVNTVDASRLNTEDDIKNIFQSRKRAEQWIEINKKALATNPGMAPEERAFIQSKIDQVRALTPKLGSIETPADVTRRRTAQTKEVFDYVNQELLNAGLTPEESRANATVWGERYWARASRLNNGMTPIQLAQSTFQGFNSTASESEVILGERAYAQMDRPFQTEIPMPETIQNLNLSGVVPSVKDARNQFKNTLQNTVVSNSHTGWQIDINAEGEGKAGKTIASEGNRIAYLNIDRLLANAIYARTEMDRRGRDSDIIGMHIFYAPFSANGTDYVVNITVRETREGKRFYDKFTLVKETPRADGTSPVGAGATPSTEDHLGQTRALLETEQSPIPAESTINIDQFIQDVKDLQKEDAFFQGGQGAAGPRGRIRFDRNRMAIIDLFQHKDRSTVMHESAHLWLEETISDAYSENANQLLSQDLDTLLEWFGLDVRTSDGESAVRSAIQVQHHEQFAEGFEAYLLEGKSPSKKLARAFAAFRVWLTTIYGAIKNMRIPLHDDVRQVFDRMVSTEAVAQETERQMGYQPLLTAEHLAMMNDNERVDYLLTVEEAKDEVRKNIMQAYLLDQEKKEGRLYKETRKRVTDEETLRLNQDQALQTEAALRSGKMPDGSKLSQDMQGLKIDRASLIALVGPEFGPRIEKLTVRKDGLPIESIAEIFGWTDPKEMISAIQNTPDFAAALEESVENRMQEIYPDRFEPETAIEDASQFYHNQAQEKLHKLEMKFLVANAPKLSRKVIEILGRYRSRNNYYREAAKKTVSSSNASTISAYRFQQSERKKNLEAHKAMASGKVDDALKAKHESLLNYELFKEARVFEDRRNKDESFFVKVFGSDKKIGVNRDMHVVMAARSLINFINGDVNADALAPLDNLKNIDPDAHQNMVNLAQDLLPIMASGKDITVQQYYELSDAIKAMWDYSREIKQLTIGEARVELAQAVEEITADIAKHPQDAVQMGIDKALGWKEDALLKVQSFKAGISRLEQWTIGMGQSLHRYIYQPLVDADTAYKNRKAEELIKLNALVEKLGPQPKDAIISSELNYEFKDVTEVLGAMVHMGNSSNLERLLLGRNWGSKNSDGSLNTSRWDSFLLRMHNEGKLTKEHYDFVQSVWDFMESHKNEAWKTHYKLQGYYPKEISVTPIQTPFGEYRGGYAPAVYDSDIRLKVDKAKSSDIVTNANTLAPSVGSGFTKERADNYYDVIKIDLNSLVRATDKTLKFTYLQPAIAGATRILNNNEFSAALNKYDRRIADNLIRPALQRLARQSASEMAVTDFGRIGEKLANNLRSKTSLMLLAWNIPNWFQNLTGFFPAMTEVKKTTLLREFKTYLTSPREFNEMIIGKSPYMRARAMEHQSQLLHTFDKVLNDKSRYQEFKEASIDFAFIGEKISNGMMGNMVWSAAYGEAIDAGMSEAKAVDNADRIVRTTQSDQSVLGMSAMESGNAFWRLFGMFSTYFNGTLNKFMTDQKLAGLESDKFKSAMMRAKAYTYLLALPAITSSLIMRGFAGTGIDADDDGEYLDDIMDILFISQLRFFLGGVPVVGSVINFGIDKFTGKSFNDKLSLSPVLGVAETAADSYKLFEKLLNGDDLTSKDSRAMAYAIGLTTGLPATIASKPIGYMLDVEAGKADPSGPIDYTRGLLTGKKGN